MAQGRKTGGRVAGTPNKATAEKQQTVDDALAEAFALLGPVAIKELMPAAAHLYAGRSLIIAGLVRPGLALLEVAMPFYDAKKVARPEAGDDSDGRILIVGGLPDDVADDPSAHSVTQPIESPDGGEAGAE